ncbi:hypothetical protein MMSR116_11195 [Methylobacterium mesophilicum SR1.6/6]|uniref:Uncharacterized protein n=1 Tax=Methylobacterium mesophilicum SR1.6/6 TaxID=908290 RepID=A0A6B9FKW5_9HYPH|nr:hypothetical protein [Methylobacterium mesophilicum]QGY02376.1 hypothetical protein MMSR116_11195 [Methylobacterium mesophilicum SR1.6/6]
MSTDEPDPVPEAAEALRLLGKKVEPWSDDFALWLVDGETLTDSDLLALAIRLGVMDSPGTLQ